MLTIRIVQNDSFSKIEQRYSTVRLWDALLNLAHLQFAFKKADVNVPRNFVMGLSKKKKKYATL